MNKTQPARDKRYNEKQAAAGNVHVRVRVPEECRQELIEIARKMREGKA